MGKLAYALLISVLLPNVPAYAAGGATYGQISPLEYQKGPLGPGRTVEFELGNNLIGVFIYRTTASAAPAQAVSIDDKPGKGVEAQTFLYKVISAGEHQIIVPDGDAMHAYDFSVRRNAFGWIYIRLNVVTENGVLKVIPNLVPHDIAKVEIKDCRYIN